MNLLLPSKGFQDGMGVYLKQVEMENFKSFGGRLTVPLMEGYTAITGDRKSVV